MAQKNISNSLTTYNGRVQKSDLNGYGFMHGGRLLTLCDEIGYLAAKKHAKCDCLTRAAHNIEFFSTMKEKALFSVQAQVVSTGKTTMWVDCVIKNKQQTVMSGVFVYIAIDKNFKSIPVPAIQIQNQQEKKAQLSLQQLYDQVTMKTEKKP